jgi:hypothetical protein
MPSAKSRIFSYQNDFGYNQRVDDCKPVPEVGVCDVKLIQHQHAVRAKRAKEQSQIQGDPANRLQLVDKFLLKGLFLQLLVIHERSFGTPAVVAAHLTRLGCASPGDELERYSDGRPRNDFPALGLKIGDVVSMKPTSRSLV